MNQRPSAAPASKPEPDEFFIGYDPPIPPGIARFVGLTVMLMILGALVWAVGFGPGHVRLEGGTFEFGRPRTFSGTIVEDPVPALRLDGQDAGTAPWALLVAPRKHGAADAIQGLNGRQVTLNGTRIVRGSHTMIEIEPASIVPGRRMNVVEEWTIGTAPIEVRGEIVDAKCFLGVMVPGAGITHKECAGLCLRGGIPPALFVQDRSGLSALLLLTGPSGESIAGQAERVVGEPIDLTGTVAHHGGWLVLRTDPATWRPITR
jgi:hypothetical protein